MATITFNGTLNVVTHTNEKKYDPLNEYNVLKSIFEGSPRFQKLDTGQRDSWYSCFKSANGAIYIEFNDRDEFDPFNVETNEDNLITICCLSNIEKLFIDDIANALESHFGYKVYYRVNVNLDFPFIEFSNTDITKNSG
jgi:hypothetical protein